MKRLGIILLTILGLIEATIAEADFYRGTAQGAGGTVSVIVHMENDILAGIRVEAVQESNEIGKPAAIVLQNELIEKQNPNAIDAVTGATATSTAILNAAKEAFEKAELPMPEKKEERVTDNESALSDSNDRSIITDQTAVNAATEATQGEATPGEAVWFEATPSEPELQDSNKESTLVEGWEKAPFSELMDSREALRQQINVIRTASDEDIQYKPGEIRVLEDDWTDANLNILESDYHTVNSYVLTLLEQSAPTGD